MLQYFEVVINDGLTKELTSLVFSCTIKCWVAIINFAVVRKHWLDNGIQVQCKSLPNEEWYISLSLGCFLLIMAYLQVEMAVLAAAKKVQSDQKIQRLVEYLWRIRTRKTYRTFGQYRSQQTGCVCTR